MTDWAQVANKRKGELIKKALEIVDELADVIDEMAEFNTDEQARIIELTERAQKLKKDGYWKLR